MVFLCKKLNIRVSFAEVPLKSGATTYRVGRIVIRLQKRTLYPRGCRLPHEWLHEIAHLVFLPPWEPTPDDASEMVAMFAWEKAVSQDLYRRGLVWGELFKENRKRFLSHMRKVCRSAGLLKKNGRPKYRQPNWTSVAPLWKDIDQLASKWNLTHPLGKKLDVHD
jgi:hypothetical protein